MVIIEDLENLMIKIEIMNIMSIGQIDIDILNFVMNLKNSIPDSALPITHKIDKGISMFKRERNLLYIDKTDEGLKAAIKSQSHPENLEYAISLKLDGSFFYGTQNLHPCGGLKGRICKHMILALIATIKQGLSNQKDLIQWVKNSVNFKPKLEKIEATAIFLRNKNALEGKIEWRPVEIFPEDFMAF
ncbi:MAG: hypothetical protein EAX96_18615 [Candidatus Lokiarchaeota archaeon]|nr:hypothetical protein [Candidatus Lokiarchaeota archaeon]